MMITMIMMIMMMILVRMPVMIVMMMIMMMIMKIMISSFDHPSSQDGFIPGRDGIILKIFYR